MAIRRGTTPYRSRANTFLGLPQKPEFEQKVIEVARVTRVTAGGKKLRFRACVAIGDGKGTLGIGVAKGSDVSLAITKAVAKAKKDLITIPVAQGTIPYLVKEKFKAARILLKPAPSGTGIIAGGSMRVLLELSGIQNVVGKILGSSNKINNLKATINAFKKLKKVDKGVSTSKET